MEDRRAIMQSLVRATLHEHARGALKHDDAIVAIAKVLDAFESGGPLSRDARPYFPFWFIGMSWEKHGGPVKPPKHDPADRRSGVYSDLASGESDCPAVVLEAVNVEPSELPLSPHVLGTCMAAVGNATTVPSGNTPTAEKRVAAAHELPLLKSNDIGRSIPVASPERIPTAPGLLTTGAKRPLSKASKSYYRGKTLIYVKLGDDHHVVDGHWDEYLELRKEQPKAVIIHGTQREMRAKLFQEGALV